MAQSFVTCAPGSSCFSGLWIYLSTRQGRGRRDWSGYVATDDVDADTARVAAAGGAIKRPPTDIPNVGRFAVVADPGGAVLVLNDHRYRRG